MESQGVGLMDAGFPSLCPFSFHLVKWEGSSHLEFWKFSPWREENKPPEGDMRHENLMRFSQPDFSKIRRLRFTEWEQMELVKEWPTMKTTGSSSMGQLDVDWNLEEAGGQEAVSGVRTEWEREVLTHSGSEQRRQGLSRRGLMEAPGGLTGAGPSGGHRDLPWSPTRGHTPHKQLGTLADQVFKQELSPALVGIRGWIASSKKRVLKP